MQIYLGRPPLAWLEFPIFSEEEGLIHASYTRLFGASSAPFNSLNLSTDVGDVPEEAARNRQKVVAHFQSRSQKSSCTYIEMNQVHGAKCHILREAPAGNLRVDCDAIATDIPNLILAVKHADCQPILLYDRKTRVIAAIHAGWRGIAQQITTKTIEALRQEWNVRPEDLIAGIGPSIGPQDCEFIHWKESLPQRLHQYVSVETNCIDLWQASQDELTAAGVKKEHIASANLSTYTLEPLFFSYRRAAITGRNATAIMLH